jgi:hypothetical protein
MNLLAIIIVFLAILTAGAIAYIAWELSSGDPALGRSAADKPADPPASGDRPGDGPAAS